MDTKRHDTRNHGGSEGAPKLRAIPRNTAISLQRPELAAHLIDGARLIHSKVKGVYGRVTDAAGRTSSTWTTTRRELIVTRRSDYTSVAILLPVDEEERGRVEEFEFPDREGSRCQLGRKPEDTYRSRLGHGYLPDDLTQLRWEAGELGEAGG
ncbi:hypothetical protein CIB48_g9440 [Xylaria polymorpha]|nr:hypothetical protein CIB48_g9440 [Xylaria polymorpha]